MPPQDRRSRLWCKMRASPDGMGTGEAGVVNDNALISPAIWAISAAPSPSTGGVRGRPKVRAFDL